MAHIVVLDTGPLALAASRPGVVPVDACLAWLAALETAGAEVLIPTVADYEVRRELEGTGAAARLWRLDQLAAGFGMARGLRGEGSAWRGV